VRRPAFLTAAAGIALGLAVCSLAAIVRTLLSGQLSVSERPTAFAFHVWCGFAAGMLLASAGYVVALSRAPGALERRHLAAAVAIHLCAAAGTPLTSNDVFLNLAHGRMIRSGLNPYRHSIGELPKGDPFAAVDWPGWRNPYGPLVLVISEWAAGWGSVAAALAAFKLCMLVATLGALSLAFRFCRSLPAEDGTRGFTAFAFNPLLAWELSGQAHNDALMVALAVGFVWAAAQERRTLAALLLGLGISVKYALAPTLALYLLALARRSRRDALSGALAGFGTIAVAWAPWWTGADTFLPAWLAVRADPARIQNSFASLVRALGYLAGVFDAAFRAWTLCTAVVMLAAAVVFARRSRTPASAIEGSLRFTSLGLALGLAYVQPWYSTWLLPFALGPIPAHRRWGLALYTASVPALYLRAELGALAILIVQSIGLALALAPDVWGRRVMSAADA
jgi:hypothetical protein